MAGLEAITSGLPSTSINWTVLSYVFGLGIAGFIAFFFLLPKIKNDIQINIRKKIGGGYGYVKLDGKVITRGNVRQLEIKKLKRLFPAPEPQYFYPMRAMFKKFAVYMYQNKDGDLIPEDFDDTGLTPLSKPKYEDLELWATMQKDRISQTYNADFLSKYGVLLAQGGMIAALIIVSVIIMNKHVEASQILASALRETSTILQAVKGGL